MLHEGQIEGGGRDGGEPAGPHQAGRHGVGQMLPGMPGRGAEGAYSWAVRPLLVERRSVERISSNSEYIEINLPN
jgi:hypothetical protein